MRTAAPAGWAQTVTGCASATAPGIATTTAATTTRCAPVAKNDDAPDATSAPTPSMSSSSIKSAPRSPSQRYSSPASKPSRSPSRLPTTSCSPPVTTSSAPNAAHWPPREPPYVHERAFRPRPQRIRPTQHQAHRQLGGLSHTLPERLTLARTRNTGLSDAQVYKLVAAGPERPSMRALSALCEALRGTPDDLLVVRQDAEESSEWLASRVARQRHFERTRGVSNARLQ